MQHGMTQPGGREGLLASLSNIAITVVAMGQTRLELLANEVETQKLTVLRMLLLAQGMMFCAGVGLLLLVALAMLLMWEQRVAVVAVCAALFVVAAAYCYRAMVRILNAPEPAFSATLAELREDMRRLKAASGHAATPD